MKKGRKKKKKGRKRDKKVKKGRISEEKSEKYLTPTLRKRKRKLSHDSCPG